MWHQQGRKQQGIDRLIAVKSVANDSECGHDAKTDTNKSRDKRHLHAKDESVDERLIFPGVLIPMQGVARGWKIKDRILKKTQPNDKYKRTKHHRIDKKNENSQKKLSWTRSHSRKFACSQKIVSIKGIEVTKNTILVIPVIYKC